MAGQDDLSVGAHVDHQIYPGGPVGAGGKHDGRSVGPHVPGDTGEDVGPGRWVDVQCQISSREVDGVFDLQSERCHPQRGWIKPKKQVVHDRVADQGEF